MTEAVARRETDILPRLTDDAIASVAANIRQFEKFKQSVLSDKDYTWMGDNQYIEKSGWVKMRMAMNCSFEILDEGRRITGRDDEGEYYTWIFKGRATAPNGVLVQMDGACSSRDEFFSMRRDDEGNPVRRRASEIDEKDIIVTAQTNCFNRCMSFLCGFGELSGEEVRGKQFAKKPATFPFGDFKGKEPEALTLAELHKLLPFWEKQAADASNKFAVNNKKLLAAIQEAIAEKTPKPESQERRGDAPQPAQEGAKPSGEGEAPPAGDVPLPTVDAWRKVYGDVKTVQEFEAVERELKKLWSKYAGEEQTALKFIRDPRKVQLQELV